MVLSISESCLAVVFDLEYTAWEGSLQRNWSKTDEDPELIQIGAVAIQQQGTRIFLGREFSIYVRPTIRPVLSTYIKNLTGITQSQIDTAVDLSAALSEFASFIPNGVPICSNGDDLEIIIRNCNLNSMKNPIMDVPFINVRGFLARKHLVAPDCKSLHSHRLAYRDSLFSDDLGTQTRTSNHDALLDSVGVANELIRLNWWKQLDSDSEQEITRN